MTTPDSVVGDLDRPGDQTRTDRAAYWFPLTLSGLLILLAAPLYYDNGWVAPIQAGQSLPMLASLGGDYVPHAEGLGWYWFGALPAGYLLSLVYYQADAARRGVAMTPRTFVRAGLIGLTIALLLPLVLGFIAYNPFVSDRDALSWLVAPVQGVLARGQMPHAIIAVGLLALARSQHSRRLAVIAGSFALLILASNLYFQLSVDDVTDISVTTLVTAAMAPAVILLAGGVFTLVRKENQ